MVIVNRMGDLISVIGLAGYLCKYPIQLKSILFCLFFLNIILYLLQIYSTLEFSQMKNISNRVIDIYIYIYYRY